VSIAAAYAKNRREDTLPLKPETAGVLAKHLAGKMPGAKAFAVPPRQHVAKMFRAALASARTACIDDAPTVHERVEREQSTRMVYRDEAGLVADFHSLRHSCGSWLLDAGVDMRVVQRIMRHCTITLTVDRYGKLRGMMGSQSQKLAVAKLPNLSQPGDQVVQATGTDGEVQTADPRLARFLAHFGGESGNERGQGGLKVSGRDERGSTSEPAKKPEKTADLTAFPPAAMVVEQSRRSGRVVDCAGLENR